jgi:hypothetical protein
LKPEVQFLAGGRSFSPLHSAHTAAEAEPASVQWVQSDLSVKVKRPGREADHSPSSSAELKNGGAIPPLPYKSSWHSTSLIKYRDKFTFFKTF